MREKHFEIDVNDVQYSIRYALNLPVRRPYLFCLRIHFSLSQFDFTVIMLITVTTSHKTLSKLPAAGLG